MTPPTPPLWAARGPAHTPKNVQENLDFRFWTGVS